MEWLADDGGVYTGTHIRSISHFRYEQSFCYTPATEWPFIFVVG